MNHGYIATYNFVSTGDPNLKFYKTEEFSAPDDETALQRAWVKESVLEALENNRLTSLSHEPKKTIVLTGVRNQFNKRTVFTVGHIGND